MASSSAVPHSPLHSFTLHSTLTFQDELSKYTVAAPIPQQDAMTVAKVFVGEIVLKFGIPQLILTDQYSNFLSDLFANV